MRTTHMLRFLGAASLVAGVTAIVFAQAPSIDLNPGLWEVTSTVDMSGAPPMDMSKMTPQQRAQTEAAMKAMMAPHATTQKKCLKKDDISRSFFEGDGDNCKSTVITNTKTVFEVKRECSGGRAESSQARLEAVTRNGMKGTIASTITQNGHTQKLNVSLTGRWVAATCGNVG